MLGTKFEPYNYRTKSTSHLCRLVSITTFCDLYRGYRCKFTPEILQMTCSPWIKFKIWIIWFFFVDSWKQGNLTLRRQSRCGPTWSNGGKSMVPIQLWRWVIRSENIPNLFFGWSCLNWSSVHFSFLESVCSYNTRFGFLSFSLGFWVQWVGRSHAILSTWLSWCW
jgi:putative component of membrane protein insertase Oxa1/YidC/SpoIIIJ protein YidD